MRPSSVTRPAREALANSSSSSEDDEDDVARRTEDVNPQVEKVTGCRKTGTRYNSSKGFIYTLHKQTKEDKIFICKHQKPKNGGCNARLRQDKVTGVYRKDGRISHNHDPEIEEQQQLAIVNACVAAALESNDAPRQIFDKVRSGLPGNIGYGEAVQRRLQRAKRERQPANPKSIAEADTLLETNPHLGTTSEGRPFYRGRVTAAGGGEAMVFVSSTLAAAFANSSEIQADATFRTVPKIFKQLFTLHVTVDGKVYPYAYAIMNRKTRHLYDAVLEKVIDVFATENPELTINTERSMTDYESAIQGALQTAFMGCASHGCWFHYKQAIWRRVQKVGLQPAFNRRPTITRIIKELYQLALLPSTEILNAFQDIKDHYKEILRRETQAHQVAVQKVYNYFYSYWIDEVGATTFSVYGLLDRTNNLVESWHRWFNALCQRSHLNFWDFIECLRRAENQKARDYLCAVEGGETGRPRTLEQERIDAAITMNGNDFVNGILNRREFLELSWKPNNREAQPAFHAALQLERQRYLAGTVRPPRNARANRHQPVPAPTAPVPERERDVAQDEDVAQDGDAAHEPEATPVQELVEERRRSSRTLQLPRHLAQFEISPSVRASPTSRNVTTVHARPAFQRRRGRPAKCRLCKMSNRAASLKCCGYQLCHNCAERLQANDDHCPDCHQTGEELDFELLQ